MLPFKVDEGGTIISYPVEMVRKYVVNNILMRINRSQAKSGSDACPRRQKENLNLFTRQIGNR